MSLFQPHVMLAYAMPASETQQDPSSAALLAASKPLLQWLNSILTEDGQSSNDPGTRTVNGRTLGRDSSWRQGSSANAQVREEFRGSSSSSQRASGSSLLGLYALAVAHEKELGQQTNGSSAQSSGSRGPLSEADGLAAMRALVNALHQPDATQQRQRQQQQQGDSTAEEASLLGSLYAYAALETATAAAAGAQRAPSSPQQAEEQLSHSRSYHRAMSGLSDLADRERSATQSPSRTYSSSQEPASHDTAVYGLLSSLQRSSSSSPHGASRQRPPAGHHQHATQQEGLAVLQLLAGLQGATWGLEQQR